VLFNEDIQAGTLIVDLKHWKEMSEYILQSIMYQIFSILQNSLEICSWHDITRNKKGITPLTIVFFEQYEYLHHDLLSLIRINDIMSINSD